MEDAGKGEVGEPARKRHAGGARRVPELLAPAGWAGFEKAFVEAQAVLIRDAVQGKCELAALAKVVGDASADLKASWSVESAVGKDEAPVKPEDFLSGTGPATCYCSFIAKTSEDFDALSKVLPATTMPLQDAPKNAVRYTNSFWAFIGRNASGEPLAGRKPHTDDVPQDGTWHLQTSGTKRWLLRPTEELLAQCPTLSDDDYEVECREGDILALNTGLWRHSTLIMPTANARDGVCASVARDFFLYQSESATGESDFTNVEGFYAPTAIEAGTVLVREKDMPDVELPRGKANCEVVELEDGDLALVACRNIAAGEWFTLAESDAESGDDDDNDDNDDEAEADGSDNGAADEGNSAEGGDDATR